MPEDAAEPEEQVPVDEVALESLDQGFFIRIMGRKGLERLRGLELQDLCRFFEDGEAMMYEN
jgi:hypothetical protein